MTDNQIKTTLSIMANSAASAERTQRRLLALQHNRRLLLHELNRVRHFLPVGAVDPAIREDQLLEELANIEAVIREELGHIPTD
jgi:hypothetical protein